MGYKLCLWMSSLSLGSPNYKHLCFIPPKEVIHDLKDKHIGEKSITMQDKVIERTKAFDKAHYGKNWIQDN